MWVIRFISIWLSRFREMVSLYPIVVNFTSLAKVFGPAADAMERETPRERTRYMEISTINTNVALASMARMEGANAAMQTTMMKQLAESQQQMAEMLQELGIGQNVDVKA